MFYENISIECMNPDSYYPWPTTRDLFIARMVSKHAVLTASQLHALGVKPKKITHLLKRGLLYRYKVHSPEGAPPSIYTAGHTSMVIGKMSIPQFPDMVALRNLLMINQVIVSILQKAPADFCINPRSPIQTINVDRPIGILVARNSNFMELPIKHGLRQAIVILPHEGMAVSGLPFRYVLESELDPDSFDISYYHHDGHKLVSPSKEKLPMEKTN